MPGTKTRNSTLVAKTRAADKVAIILLDRTSKRAAAFAGLRPRVVSSLNDLEQAVAIATKDSVWVSFARDLTDRLIKLATSAPSTLGIGLFVHPLDVNAIPCLSSLFGRIAFAADGGFISAEELAEVFVAPNRKNLFIGGFVSPTSETVTFWRGDLESLTVPFSAFPKSGTGTKPDFDRLAIIDGGQTVQFDEYEAAVDVILYEYDLDYRREISKQRLEEDRSFGAALRRLRKQRGLRREDFGPDLAAKTIARIEQGKVSRIQKATLQSLATRLSVEPEEIGSY